MKDFFKSLLAITFFIGGFFIGFHLGKSKEKAKIPKFQEEAEGDF